jgi:trimeric autotransporter adhesin
MWQAAIWLIVLVGAVASGISAPAQAPVATSPPSSPSGSPTATATSTSSAQSVVGGKLHGVVKSGNVPLPGVTVTAHNTLTGKRYSTTTDIAGAWSLTIPQNGRYVVRTQFAAFAQGSQEALLNATNHDQTVTFDLMLASRAAQQDQQQNAQSAQVAQAIRQMAGNGAQSLSLMNALSGDTETQAGSAGPTGAALPSVANNSDFSQESVAISGQAGAVSPMAGVDVDRIRDAIETYRLQNPGQGDGTQSGAFALNGGGAGAGIFMGGPGGPGGGGGFGGSGGFGGRGGGMRNFRNFDPGQPHGAIYWIGSNSALNAEPFSLRGQPQEQPPSGSNRFGITFISAPYIPHLTKPSGKDTLFLTVSGTRSSSPLDQYATVPTNAERVGDFSALGLPLIYDPTTFQQFISNGTPNVIPSGRITPQANALLNYFPEPNLPGDVQNYHRLTTQQSNTTQAGARYMRSIGANASPFGGFGRGGGGAGGGRRAQQSQGLRQSVNFNYNWAHSASDNVNIFPELGGKTSSESNSVQAGYTIGYHKVTSIFNASWNRSNSQTTNFFTNGADIATQIGILGPNGTPLNVSPINYGLPTIQLSNIAGLNQQQPSFSLSQTVSVAETLSWIHGKHNLRFGGDYRHVHRDLLAGSNATGSFIFSGLFTQSASGDPSTGSAFADLLLGFPQETTIDSAVTKSYLRDNVFDLYALDDWRALPNLTLNYGVRYEYFAPYTEKYGRLSGIDTNPSEAFTGLAQVTAGGVGPFSGKLPDSLVFPFRTAFAPRIGLALRLPKQTVIRAGFGMNYTVGQYSIFASKLAHEPPFADEQTNQEATASGQASSACAQNTPVNCLTLAQGFPAPDTIGNYALDPHYPMPYVETWNLDVQKTLPWGIVMNIGYNGSKGNHLDIITAPRALASSPNTNPANVVFNWDQAVAFSKFGAGTFRVNKRLTKGFAVGANYQYSHLIDNAGSEGTSASVGAQNWQDVNAEEGNSSQDVRQKVTGTYLYELPFGQDKLWVTTGTASHILEGFSVSGSFTFATGTPLNPYYAAQIASVGCGTGGTLRPNRVPGASVTEGGGALRRWFNPDAYSEPAANAGYPCEIFGNSARNSVEGPGIIQNNMALSKTMQLGETRSMELRATINNVFNTVQYYGVDTNVASPSFGQVTSVYPMRSFQFTARFRF